MKRNELVRCKQITIILTVEPVEDEGFRISISYGEEPV